MLIPEGRFIEFRNPRLQAAVTLRSIDCAIGCLLWHNLPWGRRVWLRLSGKKAATMTRLAHDWNERIPEVFRA